MPTVEDVVRDALSVAASQITDPLVGRWASLRYQQYASNVRISALKGSTKLTIPAALTITAAATQGSSTLTAATPGDFKGDFTGYHVRIGQDRMWYAVTANTDDALTLEIPYVGTTAASVTTTLVLRHIPLPKDARHVGEVRLLRLDRPITRTSLDGIAKMSLDLARTGTGPTHFALARTEGPQRYILVAPSPSVIEALDVTIWRRPGTLELTDDLPDGVEPWALRDGILVDIYAYNASQAAKAGQETLSATWGNREARQRTIWNKSIDVSGASDIGSEEQTFVVTRPPQTTQDIVSAYDQVWSGP